MTIAFWIISAIAISSTICVVSARNAIHALLYLILSLLSVAALFFLMGAPFAGALEVIIYAGAIMVLFVFAILMVNLGPKAAAGEKPDMKLSHWVGPLGLTACLLAVFLYAVLNQDRMLTVFRPVTPKEVGTTLFGPYLLCVELAGILLLAGVLGASHLGKREAHG